jgi:hypothetical protein
MGERKPERSMGKTDKDRYRVVTRVEADKPTQPLSQVRSDFFSLNRKCYSTAYERFSREALRSPRTDDGS